MARTFTAQRPFNVNGVNYIAGNQIVADGPVPETVGLALQKLGFGGYPPAPAGAFQSMVLQTAGLPLEGVQQPDPPNPPGEGGGEGEGETMQPVSTENGPVRRPGRR